MRGLFSFLSFLGRVTTQSSSNSFAVQQQLLDPASKSKLCPLFQRVAPRYLTPSHSLSLFSVSLLSAHGVNTCRHHVVCLYTWCSCVSCDSLWRRNPERTENFGPWINQAPKHIIQRVIYFGEFRKACCAGCYTTVAQPQMPATAREHGQLHKQQQPGQPGAEPTVAWQLTTFCGRRTV